MGTWPDDYDLNDTPEIGARIIAFIQDEMHRLEEYDNKRPQGSGLAYVFHTHSYRVAQDIKDTCLYMGLGDLVAENMYWATLPHDIGKRMLPVEIWNETEEQPSADLKNLRRSHTDLGAAIVKEELGDIDHPFINLMTDIMRYHHEQMNGKGYHGLSGDMLSMPVRLAAIVEAFDGWRIKRPHYGDRDISVPGVLKRMREEKGAAHFDMKLFEPFAEMKMREP